MELLMNLARGESPESSSSEPCTPETIEGSKDVQSNADLEQLRVDTVQAVQATWRKGSKIKRHIDLTRAVNTNNPDRELNCLRISTQRKSSTDSDDTVFTRYLPTDSANTHIRSALLNSSTTEDVQVARVETTKTGYVI
jgi:hypothetical protein